MERSVRVLLAMLLGGVVVLASAVASGGRGREVRLRMLGVTDGSRELVLGRAGEGKWWGRDSAWGVEVRGGKGMVEWLVVREVKGDPSEPMAGLGVDWKGASRRHSPALLATPSGPHGGEAVVSGGDRAVLAVGGSETWMSFGGSSGWLVFPGYSTWKGMFIHGLKLLRSGRTGGESSGVLLTAAGEFRVGKEKERKGE